MACGYPQYILDKAAELNDDNETVKTKFNPLYDKILFYWFPPSDGYTICPRWTIPDPPTNNRTITLVIEHQHQPLLLIDVKSPSGFHLDLKRQGAISQMKQYFDELGPTNQRVERLYAISAIGKRWRAGYATKGMGSKGAQPVRGVASVNSLKSAGPDCWNPDITSNDSWVLLKSIVDTIKGYVSTT
ncbi:hypothetical protein EDB83DRAFT_2361199 [Lactarius deliciosus]|nr:hypothetical protein EDB83DRAFT_2361199 [Lactarius deliciosus]